jgi:hypothetical protein
MEKQLNITYESSLTNIVSVNPSFDLGVLKVAYTGLNRNNSFISEESFERCINTIYNCPIVCNYNRDTDSIGSHDIEIVKEDNTYKIINITQPVGVVPESAKYWWEDIIDNGISHRYLCVEVLLWKRQEAYEHIKDNKVTKHSMEIDVINGNFTNEGYYNISDFVFTALCLLESAEPCFESSALHMFSKDDFKEQFTQMMKEFKDYAIQSQSSSEVDINKNKTEGGRVLNEETRNSILQEFSLTLNDIDFEITDEMSEEGLRAKLEEFTKGNGEAQANTEPEAKVLFSATYRQKREALNNALSSDVVYDAEGNLIEETYYWVADFDDEYVYVEKSHWTKDGGYDEKHGRYTYSFDTTTLTATITSEFEEMVLVWLTVDENQKIQEERSKFELLVTEFDEYKSNYSTPNSEVERLQNFEKSTKDAKYVSDVLEVFTRFEKQLNGIAEFETLKTKYDGIEVDTIEEKCFAMLGKKNANFSAKPKDTVVKLPIDHKEEEIEDPYGGLLAKKYNK